MGKKCYRGMKLALHVLYYVMYLSWDFCKQFSTPVQLSGLDQPTPSDSFVNSYLFAVSMHSLPYSLYPCLGTIDFQWFNLFDGTDFQWAVAHHFFKIWALLRVFKFDIQKLREGIQSFSIIFEHTHHYKDYIMNLWSYMCLWLIDGKKKSKQLFPAVSHH